MATKYEKIEVIGGCKVLKHEGNKRRGSFLKDKTGNTAMFDTAEAANKAIEADKPKEKKTKKTDK